jgi:NADH-quinone oxidoreductase E subunit
MINKKHFLFDEANIEEVKRIINKYPEGRQKSAILPILDIAQRQNEGYLSKEAIEYVADMLGVPHIKAYEVASFYSMFNLGPVGKYHVQICGTTPCWLRGSEKIKEACKKELHIDIGETTRDNIFTLSEVECLGACVNAPMMQINDDYYEDLDEELTIKILKDLKAGKQVQVGSQIGRQCSKP